MTNVLFARRVRVAAITAGALLLAASVASTAASALIARRFPQRPMPGDLLLDALPHLDGAQYAADVIVIAAMGLLALYAARKDPLRMPRIMAAFALMYLLRAALIVLTPLASPHGAETFGLLPPQNGMFPSGHSAATMLCFLLVDPGRAPVLRRVMLALAAGEWAALLLSRGHYSIDIAGGLLLAYFVTHELTEDSRLLGRLARVLRLE